MRCGTLSLRLLRVAANIGKWPDPTAGRPRRPQQRRRAGFRYLDRAIPFARQQAGGLRPYPLFQFLYQLTELRVARIEGEQFARITQRRGEVPVVSGERNQRSQYVAICRMLPVRLLEESR